jgi:GT2 family glycosyltransferase
MVKFAAFIITYERSDIILATIDKILTQSLSPEKLLVVDNSESYNTQTLIEQLNNPRIQYHRVGYNGGPALAAKIGLQRLVDEGYDWIAWCDDDDPPKFEDSFELVLKSVEGKKNIGIAGAVGSRFNWSTGILTRLKDEELNGLIAVDSIAGGMVMMINAEVVRKGILPDEQLFFGFEELDFCFRTKQAGFEIVVNGEMAYRYREDAGRLNIEDRKDLYRGWKFRKSKETLWREYYSIRNFCYLMLYKYRRPKLVALLLLRVVYKMVSGFRVYGGYGFLNVRILLRALKDAYLKRLGRNDEVLRLIKH